MKKLLILFICVFLNADDTLEEFYKGFNNFHELNGYSKNYKEALIHFSKIEDKNENAKYYLMRMFYEGWGTEPNKEEFLKRYKDLNYKTRFLR